MARHRVSEVWPMDSDAALSYNDDDGYSSLPVVCLEPYHTHRWLWVAIVSVLRTRAATEGG